MDNKRYLIALALSMGVILLWTYFVIPHPKPPASAPQTAPSAQVEQPAGSQTTGPHPGGPDTEAGAGPTAAAPPDEPAAVPEEREVREEEATAAEEKTVETTLYRIRFQNRGGRIVSWQL